MDNKELNTYLFNVRLKDLKKRLPKRVSFIATMKGADAQMYIRVKIDKDFYRFTIPNDLSLTESDWSRIVTLIFDKIS